MTDHPNPMRLDGFEFVEFAATEVGVIEPVLESLGFARVAQHRSKDVALWRQGDINFVVNHEPRSPAWYLAEEHGACAAGIAFRVEDAQRALARAVDLGAEPVDIPCGPMELRLPAIRGIGGAPLYLIDRYDRDGGIYDIDFRFVPGVRRRPAGVGLRTIDHLTHNVHRGRLDHWARYYSRLFNFREIRRFDIQGERTGLVSRAMTAPDDKIRIPLNEEASGGGQIDDFLQRLGGEGVQHIALACENLPAVCDRLRANGVPFVGNPPAAYYDMLDECLPGHGEPVAELARRGILLDGDTAGAGAPRLLLQIFSKELIGPLFFEFIERKRDEGFGEGNFQALFESLERDQSQRGGMGEPGAQRGWAGEPGAQRGGMGEPGAKRGWAGEKPQAA